MRLIEADDLKRSFNKLCDRFGEDFHISAIETEIDAAQTVDAADVLRNQWVSVQDRLPETVETINRNSEDEFSLSSPVLTFGKNGFAIAMVERDEHHEIFVSFDGDAIEEVTHWMPLPEPPEVDKP